MHTGQTGSDGTKDVEIIVPLKYLSSFWQTLEMPLINCETNLLWKRSKACILVVATVANQNPCFQINDIKLYFLVVTLSTQENMNFLSH